MLVTVNGFISKKEVPPNVGVFNFCQDIGYFFAVLFAEV